MMCNKIEVSWNSLWNIWVTCLQQSKGLMCARLQCSSCFFSPFGLDSLPVFRCYPRTPPIERQTLVQESRSALLQRKERRVQRFQKIQDWSVFFFFVSSITNFPFPMKCFYSNSCLWNVSTFSFRGLRYRFWKKIWPSVFLNICLGLKCTGEHNCETLSGSSILLTLFFFCLFVCY